MKVFWYVLMLACMLCVDVSAAVTLRVKNRSSVQGCSGTGTGTTYSLENGIAKIRERLAPDGGGVCLVWVIVDGDTVRSFNPVNLVTDIDSDLIPDDIQQLLHDLEPDIVPAPVAPAVPVDITGANEKKFLYDGDGNVRMVVTFDADGKVSDVKAYDKDGNLDSENSISFAAGEGPESIPVNIPVGEDWRLGTGELLFDGMYAVPDYEDATPINTGGGDTGGGDTGGGDTGGGGTTPTPDPEPEMPDRPEVEEPEMPDEDDIEGHLMNKMEESLDQVEDGVSFANEAGKDMRDAALEAGERFATIPQFEMQVLPPKVDYISLDITGRGDIVRVPTNPFSEEGPFGGVMAEVASFVRTLLSWGIVAAFFIWCFHRIREMCAAPFNVPPFGDSITTNINSIRIAGFGGGIGYAAKLFAYAMVLAVLVTLPVIVVNVVTGGIGDAGGYSYAQLKAMWDEGPGMPYAGMLAEAIALSNQVIPWALLIFTPIYYFAVSFIIFPSQIFWMMFIKFLPL